jgi:Putative transposase/Transposase zinc-binding domain
MKYRSPISMILKNTRPEWDDKDTPTFVRNTLRKVLSCGTRALGAEVYSSQNSQRIVYHTCKSPFCPSCGHRATIQWQRERFAALPDTKYKGITLTMPDVLWPLFRDNPELTQALPKLAAALIQTHAKIEHGLKIGVIAVVHTFNGRLQFNAHVHTMVTSGGVDSRGVYKQGIFFDQEWLAIQWRCAVIRLLRTAAENGLLAGARSKSDVLPLLAEQEVRRWIIRIQQLGSKEHFLRYAGRYVRRPPIAGYRIREVSNDEIAFSYPDKRSHRQLIERCTPNEFVRRLMSHIRPRYRHAALSFGIFAPRNSNTDLASAFRSLKQKPRPRPNRISWRDSIIQNFGRDPLIDQFGQRMVWIGKLRPVRANLLRTDIPKSPRIGFTLN